VAVGNYQTTGGRYRSFADTWNGLRWTMTRVPAVPGFRESVFQNVSCPSPTVCVAVGNTYKPKFLAFAETWMNGRWAISKLPHESLAGVFYGVSCPSPTLCVAVGSAGRESLAEKWDGTTWSRLSPVRTGGRTNSSGFYHVSCATTAYCVAVGYRYDARVDDSDQTLIEVWNGTAWTVQRSPNP
jgi:hypothetical protein